MRRKGLFWIIILLCFCLIGIAAFQIYWIRQAWSVNSEKFNQQIEECINRAIEKQKAVSVIALVSSNGCDTLISDVKNADSLSIRISTQSACTSDSDTHRITQVLMSNSNLPFPATSKVVIKNIDSLNTRLVIHNVLKSKMNEVGGVLENIIQDFRIDKINRGSSYTFDSIGGYIQREFKAISLDVPFEYAVISGDKQDRILFKSKAFPQSIPETVYKRKLFTDNLFAPEDILLVHIPDRNSLVINSMIYVIVGSMILMLVILFTFSAAIYQMLRQKKLNEIRTDFINNMTHEFKTPLATIGLAADSINTPKVIHDPEQIRYFTRIIKEENVRMNAHVEQVLQMALLDKKEFGLDLQQIDVMDVLSAVIEKMSLILASRDGVIRLENKAQNTMIQADECHLTNVFLNIFDNANKYSASAPEIEVLIFNRDKRVIIQISDKGIGMNREQQKHIFEKFYRVTSGNIHNIKGFGLGLSYARAIVLALRGDIRVKSELHKGSTFELDFPLSENNF